jgi:nucleotide-binding universal stress UspA family protein
VFTAEAAIRDRAMEEDRLQAPERFERAKQLLEATAGVVIHTTVLEGEPARALVDEAARWNADLVVIGSHVYSAVHRALLGSVSEHVAVHAPCSVELARCPEPTTS